MSIGSNILRDPRIARIDPADVFALWDLGKERHRIDWALDLLDLAIGGMDWEALCDLPIGRRDGLLLAVRGKTFGRKLDLIAACPECAEKVEFTMDVADLIVADPFDLPPPETPGILTSATLAQALAGQDDQVLDDDQKVSLLAGDLRRLADPLGLDPVLLEQALTRNDPMAILGFPMACPACDTEWKPVLDVPEMLWVDIVSEGKRALADVHDLARAYGWTEQTILSMNADRRRDYIDMIHR